MSLSFRSGPFYSLSGGRLIRRADMAALDADSTAPDDEIRDGFAILHDGQMISRHGSLLEVRAEADRFRATGEGLFFADGEKIGSTDTARAFLFVVEAHHVPRLTSDDMFRINDAFMSWGALAELRKILVGREEIVVPENEPACLQMS